MSAQDWWIQLVLPALAVAGITGYVKLAFSSLAKDIRKSSERTADALSEIKTAVLGHEERIQKVELSQAHREGREAAEREQASRAH